MERVMTNEEAKMFLDNLKICIDEHPVVADWLVEIANRKTEPQYDIDKGTIKCDNCSENGSFKCSKCDGEMYFKRLEIEDEPQSDARKFLGCVCETCKHRDEEWDSEACDGCCENDDHYEPTISKMEQIDKDINVRSKEPQTERSE